MNKFLFYLLFLGGLIAAVIAIISFGQDLGHLPNILTSLSHEKESWYSTIYTELARSFQLPVVTLLLQILVIIIVSRLCALAANRVGQPQVIGEMIAGIVLGKSVLALLSPEIFSFIFPESSMPRLFLLGQFGLIFFMFIVGMDLNLNSLRKKASSAIFVSHVSMALPFVLGKKYAPKSVPFTSFSFFMGIAMSITAFPVLAKIMQERKLMNTSFGALTITCAAVDDVTAWCLLAFVLGVVKTGTTMGAVTVIFLSTLYILMMFKWVRPLLERLLRSSQADGSFSRGQYIILLATVLSSSLVAELIGIHTLFGAFLAGVVMPRGLSSQTNLMDRIDGLSTTIFLPLFFTFTGIRTQIGLLDDQDSWIACGVIIVAAIIGKLFGSAFAARGSGFSWREAWAVGTLMNTRGLMELVVLNIGLDIGIITPTFFTIMVVLALVTTVMTGPLLTLLLPAKEYLPVDNSNAVGMV